jgi:hypothetical protein
MKIQTCLLAILVVTSNFVYCFGQIDTGLIAYYDFYSSNTLDGSGNQNHGFGIEIEFSEDRFGNPDHSCLFNGTNSYIQLPDSLLNEAELSISLWMKSNSNGVLIAHQNRLLNDIPNQWVPILYVREDNSLNASFWQGIPENIDSSMQVINDDEWHHIAIAADQDTQLLYVDNNLEGFGHGLMLLPRMIKVFLGVGYSGGSWESTPGGDFYYDGLLDDIRIYNRLISAEQVDSLFNASNPVSNNEISEVSIRAYPNPASDELNLTGLDINLSYSYSIISTTGKKLIQGSIHHEEQLKIPLDKMIDGHYIIVLRNIENEILFERKFIKH